MAVCEGCGNQHAYALHIVWPAGGKKQEWCNECGTVSGNSAYQPDVYWPGRMHHDENIVDTAGKPILIESRRHKAALMKERGMREANDRVKGAPGHRGWKR